MRITAQHVTCKYSSLAVIQPGTGAGVWGGRGEKLARMLAASAPGTAVCAELTGTHARARTLAEVTAGNSSCTS